MLNASQVALSIILPFVSAPLIWFTSRRTVMSVDDLSSFETDMQGSNPKEIGVATSNSGHAENGARPIPQVDMSNSWPVTILGVLVWLFITGLNLVSPSFYIQRYNVHCLQSAASICLVFSDISRTWARLDDAVENYNETLP